MTEDPRCCGSGMCIIDSEGRCWCGQQWDGQKMCAPPLAATPASADAVPRPGHEHAPETGAGDPPSTARRLLALAALALPLAAFAPRPASAQGAARPAGPRFTAAEVKSLQATVQGQLSALADGDAARAYAYASAAIQQQFGDASRFMAMVLTAYPMIVKPSSVAFRLPERSADSVVQPVQLRDSAGRAWLATYRLEAQADGGWRIGGCVVTADDQRLST